MQQLECSLRVLAMTKTENETAGRPGGRGARPGVAAAGQCCSGCQQWNFEGQNECRQWCASHPLAFCTSPVVC